MTHTNHALTQITVDTNAMFPRYKPRDLLFLKRLFQADYPFHHNSDIAVITCDGRIVIGRFYKHDAQGVTLSQLSHDTPILIAQDRDPILYRVTGFAPTPVQPINRHQTSAA